MGVNFIEGIVEKGLGEGKFFMSLNHYKKEIKNKLGFDAFEGTLNIKVKKSQINLFKNIKKIKINGFKSDNATYYVVNCYKANIKNIEGAIIIPVKTKHEDVIEFIAPIHLKSALNIQDGDKIKIELK